LPNSISPQEEGGYGGCTGSLLNDTRSIDFQPFLLTANHCFNTQASATSLEATFDYESVSCGGATNTNTVIINGSGLLAENSQTDVTLVLLNEDPTGTRTYLGWSTGSVANNTTLHSVHHPSGLPQKYSRLQNKTSPDYTCSSRPIEYFLYSVLLGGQAWHGSSGSPVVTEGNVVVGQMLGPCGDDSDVCDFSAYYLNWGRFSESYSNNNFSYWLNSGGSSVAMSTSPSSAINYGTVNVGSSSSVAVTVNNTGTVPNFLNLEAGSPTITGTNASDFTIVGTNFLYLAPASSGAFTVRFQPTSPGMRTATLNIPHNADNISSPRTITLTGYGNPCSDIISLGGGGSTNIKTFDVSGTGSWYTATNTPCGDVAEGVEQVYSFVPTRTGYYSIEVTSTNNTVVAYMWKSGACSSTGWSCIDEISYTGTYGSIYMTAGATYHILLDDKYTSATTHSFYIFYNPCLNVSAITGTGSGYSKTYAGGGNGAWYTSSASSCGYVCPGMEQVYSFVPPVTGVYKLEVTAAIGWVDYMLNTTCASSGWSCLGDLDAPETLGLGTLTGGTTYYILLDDEDVTAGAHTFFIYYDPCENITPIAGTGAGNEKTYPGGGNGIWNTATASVCGYNCPGREQIYSFTPTTTGLYSVVVTAATGYVDYMYKSTACFETGWTCIDDILSAGTYGSFLMVAGNTYYILLDDETTTAGAHTFYLTLTEEAGTWLGHVSNDWYEPDNWSASYVPTADLNVTVNTGYTYHPIIASADAYCNYITIGPGAKISIGAGDLNVNADMTVNGQVEMTSVNADIYLDYNINWETGSTANITANGQFHIEGDWYFNIGANVQLMLGSVYFQGDKAYSYIRNYESNCHFNNLINSKSSGYLYFSSWSTDTLNVNGSYQNSSLTSLLVCNDDNPFVLKGQLVNNGSITCPYGTFIFDGTSHSINLNTGDYFNNLVINSTGNTALADSLRVYGSLTINSGILVTNNYPILIKGDWNNMVGSSGFSEGTGKVVFNGGNYHQYCSDETFYTLELDKPLGGAFRPMDHDVVCSFYDWTAGAIDVFTGSFTADNLIDNGLYGSYYVNPGGVINLTNPDGFVDLRGDIYNYGGTINVYSNASYGDSFWPFNNNGSITMNGGVIDFKNVGILVYNTGAYTLTENITAGTIRTAGGFRVERGDFTPLGGTIEFYGPTDGLFHTINGGTVNNIMINKGLSDNPGMLNPVTFSRETGVISDVPVTNTVTIDNTATMTGNVTIQDGILSAGANLLSLGGNWNNTVGTSGFNEGTSYVTFNGASASEILSGETFYNLTLDKTYLGYNGLEFGSNVNVSNDLYVADGTIEMDVPASLNVAGNLTLLLNTGLNANDGNVQISVGKNWTNNNTTYSSTVGFDPGSYSTVEFNGSGEQSLTTSCPQEDFANLVINKSASKFRSYDNIQVFGDLTIQNGTWEDWISGLTHTMYNDFTVGAGGLFSNLSYRNTVQFIGGNDAVLTYNSISGYFYNLSVNKSGGASVTQVGNTSCQFTGTFIVNNGEYNMNGNYFIASGGLTINSGAVFSMPAGSDLVIVGGQTLNVNNGGLLNISGIAGNLATIRCNVTTSRYNFNVNSGANIAAEYCTFKHMTTNGVNVMSGALVDPAHAFRGCVFQDGQALGTLLTINNSQTLTVRNAEFPSNTWGGSYNVSKGLNAGQIYFVDYSGAFSGETFDNDAFGRVTWVAPLVTTPTATPAIICTGSTSQLHANPAGGIGPYTYLWSPATGLSSTLIENPVATLTGNVTYHVVVTDALGTTASNTVTVTVVPYLPVSVTIVASSNPSPPGNFVLFTATPVNGGSFPSYQWKVNGANAGTGLSTYSYVPSNNDVVTCVMTSSYLCPTGNPATSNAITMIIVNTNTTVTGTVPSPLSLCFDASNTITVAGGGTTFTVEAGGSATMIAGQRIRYLPTTIVHSGGYMHGYITLTHSYCGILAPAIVATTTGTPEWQAQTETAHFALYPNPNAGIFTLTQLNTEPGTVEVEILTIKGEKIFNTTLRNVFKGTFDLRNQSSGMYLVKIRKANDFEVMKLIISR
jgi:hypothetical protein